MKYCIKAGILLFIDELLVNKDYRKKGIGNRLISIVEEKYTDADIVSIIILTDKDTDAYKLYKAKNYESGGIGGVLSNMQNCIGCKPMNYMPICVALNDIG